MLVLKCLFDSTFLDCSDMSPSTVFVVVIRQSDLFLHGGIGVVEESPDQSAYAEQTA